MRKIFLTMAFLLLLTAFQTARAEQVTIAWNPNTESDLAGYKHYYGTSSRIYDNSVDVGNQTSYTILNLVAGTTYFLAVTAYDTSGNESDYSNEITYTPIDIMPPGSPINIRIIIITQ